MKPLSFLFNSAPHLKRELGRMSHQIIYKNYGFVKLEDVLNNFTSVADLRSKVRIIEQPIHSIIIRASKTPIDYILLNLN